MKKITLFLTLMSFAFFTSNLMAQTFFSVSMNDGTTYNSGVSGERFAGFPWGGLGNHVFTNANSKNIKLDITGYDETTVGPELYIRFSRVGFGNAPLNWGSDMVTSLQTLTASDFTAGAATVYVDIPAGTVPVTQTANYVSGYRYILQIVGDNVPEAYINYVSDVQEQILSTNDFNKSKLGAFYSSSKDAVVVDNNISGKYSIFNLLGQAVQQGEIKREISVATLKSGLYILTTESGLLKFAK